MGQQKDFTGLFTKDVDGAVVVLLFMGNDITEDSLFPLDMTGAQRAVAFSVVNLLGSGQIKPDSIRMPHVEDFLEDLDVETRAKCLILAQEQLQAAMLALVEE